VHQKKRTCSPEPRDQFGRPVGDVEQGPLSDLPALTITFPEQDGRRRASVRDGIDVHAAIIAAPGHQIQPKVRYTWLRFSAIFSVDRGRATGSWRRKKEAPSRARRGQPPLKSERLLESELAPQGRNAVMSGTTPSAGIDCGKGFLDVGVFPCPDRLRVVNARERHRFRAHQATSPTMLSRTSQSNRSRMVLRACAVSA